MTDFKIDDRVRTARSRLAVQASPYYWLYAELWGKYGNREGKVIGFSSVSAHRIEDTEACVIQFSDGDTIAWEAHLLERLP